VNRIARRTIFAMLLIVAFDHLERAGRSLIAVELNIS
jgi:hypothetical protein